MKIKNGYSIIRSNDSFIVAFNGVTLEKAIYLNEIGAFLWDCLKEKDCTANELLNLLLDKFEISTVLALGEIDTFIKNINENGIFE